MRCIELDGVSTADMKCSSSFSSVQEIDTTERCICLTRDVQTSLSLSMASTVSKVTRTARFRNVLVLDGCSHRTACNENFSLVRHFRWRRQLSTPRAKFWCLGFQVTKPPSRGPHRGQRKGNRAQTPKRLVGSFRYCQGISIKTYGRWINEWMCGF